MEGRVSLMSQEMLYIIELMNKVTDCGERGRVYPPNYCYKLLLFTSQRGCMVIDQELLKAALYIGCWDCKTNKGKPIEAAGRNITPSSASEEEVCRRRTQ